MSSKTLCWHLNRKDEQLLQIKIIKETVAINPHLKNTHKTKQKLSRQDPGRMLVLPLHLYFSLTYNF